MMHCKNCNTINEEDALYCKKCGLPLQDEQNSKKKKDKSKNKTKVKKKTKTKVKKVKQKVKTKNNKNKEKGSFGKNLFIFILVMLVICLFAVAAVMGYHIYNEEKNITVPNLYHLSYEEAELLLAKSDLKIAKKEQTVEEQGDDNIVITQNKKAGTKVSKNTTIKVTVGKYDYSYIVGNYIGKNLDEVKNEFNHDNIKYQIIEEEVTDEDEHDVIINQTPKKGTKITKDKTIKITVGKYIEEVPNESDHIESEENITEEQTKDNEQITS